MKFTNFNICTFAVLVLVGISTTLFAAEEATTWWDEPWRFSAKFYGSTGRPG